MSDAKDQDFFDEKQFVDLEIAPLAERIYKLCAERKIPMIFIIQGVNKEDGEQDFISCGTATYRAGTTQRMRLIAALANPEAVPASVLNEDHFEQRDLGWDQNHDN